MKASVDKFGRYRGGTVHARSVGPPGVGFSVDPDGNYDMKSKRLTNVGQGTAGTDAASFDQLRAVANHASHAIDLIFQKFPERFPIIMDAYISEHKKDKFVPLISEVNSERFSSLEQKLSFTEQKLEALQTIADELIKSRSKWDADMLKTKSETQDELKALSDVIRAFVYEVTSPSYQRNSAEKEQELRSSVSKGGITWKHVYPEITLR